MTEAPMWRCRDGRQLRPGEMSARHIRNAIRMIERSAGVWRGRYLYRLKLELELRRKP